MSDQKESGTTNTNLTIVTSPSSPPKSSSTSLSVKSSTSSLLPTAGNATGTNRTKVALKPGFGLVGWVRHAAQSKNLSGVEGPRKAVSPVELKKHNTEGDCWMSIHGQVFNVTEYADYHPGGVDELMRGAGTNATKLFEENHCYVNYQSLLEKCYVGPLGHDCS